VPRIIGQLLFLGSPLLLVAIANGLCIKYDWIKSLKKPLDLGLRFRGKRIFGDHKTWRGLVINVAFSVLGASIQGMLQGRGVIPSWILLVDYQTNGPLLGLLLGMGMTAGELPNSFLKRQMEISPGRQATGVLSVAFFLLDQIDLALGIWIFIFVVVRPPISLVLWSLVLTLVLHVAVSAVGYALGMRKTPV
jgi:CDP-diglyceride synthetase